MHPPRAIAREAEADTDIPGLIRRASAGDQGAWRDLIGLYAARVFALARSRLGDDECAEEIVQSVFVTVAGRLTQGAYLEQGKFEAWLFRIAMNRIRDEGRRRRRVRARTEPAPEPVFQPQADGVDGATLARLRRALDRLSDADRQVVELRHHAAMSFKDIAGLLGQPLGTVLARHHRSLKRLCAMMEGEL